MNILKYKTDIKTDILAVIREHLFRYTVSLYCILSSFCYTVQMTKIF